MKHDVIDCFGARGDLNVAAFNQYALVLGSGEELKEKNPPERAQRLAAAGDGIEP
jgi:hypothetical protein